MNRGVSAGTLKVLACVSMLIDHITYCFIPEYIMGTENVWYYIGRGIGRSAFIIFSFLLVEGFFNTKDIKKYCLRLLFLALLSEAPFDFMYGRLNENSFLILQNILFTFLIALVAMYVLEFLKKAYIGSVVKYSIFGSIICSIAFLAVYFLRIDYGVVGIGLVFVFYFFRGTGKALCIAVIVWSVVCAFLEYQLEWAGLIALVPILKFYNGERGKDSKWLFYTLYPLHMLLLGFIQTFVSTR